MAAVIIFSDFWAQENKVCHCFHCFPIYLLWSDGTRCHDLHFWMLSFKPAFSLSTFSFIRKIFSSSSLSTIRVMLSAYLSVRGMFNFKGSNMLFSPFVCCFSRTLCSLSVPGKQERAELHAVLRTEIMGKSTCLDSLQWLPSVIF